MVLFRGGVRDRGACVTGGMHDRGACVTGGGACMRATHAPPVNRITDRCKNITFANYVCGQ